MGRENNLGTAEIVDTLIDFTKLELSVYDKIADGLQLLDALQFGLEAYPVVNEIIQDGSTFWAEVKNVFPLEGIKVWQDVAGAFNAEDQARSRIIALIKLLATGYVYVDDTVKRLNELKGLAIDIAK